MLHGPPILPSPNSDQGAAPQARGPPQPGEPRAIRKKGITSTESRAWVQLMTEGGTHHGGVPEALDGLEDPPTDHPHGEGTTTVVHDAPWAAGREGSWLARLGDLTNKPGRNPTTSPGVGTLQIPANPTRVTPG